MFGIFRKRKNQSDLLGEFRRSTEVESFMIAFLSQIVRSGTRQVRVRRSEGLPKVQTISGEALHSDYDKVVNRLKVSSMLNPVCYSEPVNGGFGFCCLGNGGQMIEVKIETHFDDREPEPLFEVRIAQNAS
jgi:hypothetical protein